MLPNDIESGNKEKSQTIRKSRSLIYSSGISLPPPKSCDALWDGTRSFRHIRKELVVGVDIIVYRMLTQMTCTNDEQVSLYSLRKGDLGHMSLKLRKILL